MIAIPEHSKLYGTWKANKEKNIDYVIKNNKVTPFWWKKFSEEYLGTAYYEFSPGFFEYYEENWKSAEPKKVKVIVIEETENYVKLNTGIIFYFEDECIYQDDSHEEFKFRDYFCKK